MRLSNFITQSASSLLGMKWRSCSQSFEKNSFLADRQETDGSTPLTTGDGRPETRDGRLQKSQLLKLCKPPKLINNQFPILNNQFPITNTQSLITNNQFPITNSQFPITKYQIPNHQYPIFKKPTPKLPARHLHHHL